MGPEELMAHAIVFGQFEGGKWDWGRMCWREAEK